MPTHVALFRGVNVGGNNKLPMKDLARLFETAGAKAARTYIQSGNVVFSAPTGRERKIVSAVGDAVEERFGFRSVIVVRSASELADVAQANPFLAEAGEDAHLHVGFLAERPSAALIATLDPARSPGDRFVVRGADVFLHFPGGVGKTKLTSAYFDSKLKTTITLRNWRTVLALRDLAQT